MGLAALLAVVLAVAAPRVGASVAVGHANTQAKATVDSMHAPPAYPPPPKLAPLHAGVPTPAQRVMPDLY